jgi:hypothetical protein
VSNERPKVSLVENAMRQLFLRAVLPVIVLIGCDHCAVAQAGPWKQLGEGLFLGEFQPSGRSAGRDSKITVVKIDPAYYTFKLLSASDHGKVRKTAREWCQSQNLAGAINAGMFQEDGLTNVGYMRSFDHVNNPRVNSYNTFLAFDPKVKGIPEIQIIDRTCQKFEVLRTQYNTLVQNIRMISCSRQNTWAPQTRTWSIAALGMDHEGHVLFIASRTAYAVHDFIDILLSLPISIRATMYLEGGPEVSLYVSAGGIEIEKFGTYAALFDDDNVNAQAWRIPNVIGIVKKSK